MGKGNEDLFSDLFSKVIDLEKTMKTFRAEMDMKMKIVEQVLTVKNEQFGVLRQLLDQENALYDSVLNHWNNTNTLAENGLSLNFTSVEQPDAVTIQEVNISNRKSSSSARRDRKRRLFQKTMSNTDTKIDPNNILNIKIDENQITGFNLDSKVESTEQTDEVFKENSDSYEENLDDPDYDPFHTPNTSKKPKTVSSKSHQSNSPDQDGKSEMSRQTMMDLINSGSNRVTFRWSSRNSTVWKSFQNVFVDDKDAEFVRCCNCGIVYKWLTKNGTTTLKRHLSLCNKTSGETSD